MFYLSSRPPSRPHTFIHEQETDNRGTYGGQEVMQINVSQHPYFWPSWAPVWGRCGGQLSIIGPQMISEEGLLQERGGRGGWGGGDAKEILGVREMRRDEGWEKLTKSGEKRMESGVCCIFMIAVVFTSTFFWHSRSLVLSTLDLYLQMLECGNISKDVEQEQHNLNSLVFHNEIDPFDLHHSF